MRKNRSGGHTHIWVEHLQACLRESYPVKDSASPPQHNLLAETGRLDSVHVVERLHPNGTRLYCAGYNP